MCPRLIFATRNSHKLKELELILTSVWKEFPSDLLATMSDFGIADPVEDGVSFAENALLKARAVCQETGISAVADDSGLCVDILGGAPGIFSARWSGDHGNDRANLDLLLAQLSDVPPRHRQASFVCAAAVVFPSGEEYVEMGQLSGTLLSEPQGEGGFGYDPIFLPSGCDVTTAQMSPSEKNAMSHRGIALRALAPRLLQAFQ
ncbi:MAG: non-canonical purine NTP pyrophosphatase, RdgB/HAM1 family [Actinobacteria bacterium]|nr:MAG: non-canonical purine NTP pyrophosphatase, RdgB/HAM1 family [Actinomycetota bacterium]